MENIPPSQQKLLPKTKLIETLNSFLQKPQEEFLLSDIEAALEPFWEMCHDAKRQFRNGSDSDVMNKLAEFIKQYKEKKDLK